MKFRCLALIGALGMAGVAMAQDTSTGLRLTYDMGGSPVTLTRDAAGTVQVDGLPYPGLVLYVPATGVVYYQHPEEVHWLAITPSDTEVYANPAVLVAGKPWQPYLDAPTQRWEVKVAQMQCDNWFTSAKAAAVSGLNVGDMWRVFTSLQWLQAGSAAPLCERLAVDAKASASVGLPLYFNAPGGLWQLTELTQAEVANIPLPSTPQPVDDDVRLRVLMHQFSPDDRAAVMKDISNLPVARQIEQVQKMLGETAAF